jgi:hypothetical protein
MPAAFAADPVPAGTPLPDLGSTPSPAKLKLSWETGAGKSYLIPALDIAGFDLLLNLHNRRFIDREVYGTNFSTFKDNLRAKWVVDTDPFNINQFLHPYQGSMYHGFSRSAGLNYWESAAYTFAGSALWETAGETTKPSKNDQVASGIAGSFLGEPLFRMANLVLEKSNMPRFWRELAAAGLSPSTGFNRLAFGDRFDTVFPSRDPAYFLRLQVGASLTAITSQGPSTSLIRNEAVGDFYMDYGLPGKPDYSYRRPFDYFNFQFTASSANTFENIMSRGLLFGTEYGTGSAPYRGVWGLYGTYDYIAPQIFRVSNTALSLGTTNQVWMSDSVALQTTALAGLGYGAAGTIHGVGERDYHYGMTPQVVLATRLLFSDKAAVDFTVRDYYVSRVASTEDRGWENIARAEAGVTWRVHNRHAVALKYVYSRRQAWYPDLGDRFQSRGTVMLYYTFLGDTRFGAVDWRGGIPER